MLFLLCFTFVVMASPKTVWINLADSTIKQKVKQLNIGFIEQQQGTKYAFHVKDLRELENAGVPYEAYTVTRSSIEGYHSPEEIITALKELALASPMAEYIVLGRSVQNREIGALRLGAPYPRAQFRILGTHHGDELPSGELTLHLAEYLISQVENNHLQSLLSERAIWFVPQVNPDGAAIVSRYNANIVDLNRNYNHQWSANAFLPGPNPFSEPETQAIRTLNHLENFAGGLSIHSGATNLGWVWNYTTSPSPDNELVTYISNQYMDACTQDSFWITNGAEWYITNGDTTDWSYGKFGVLDFTLEISVDKIPPSDQLTTLFDSHRQALVNFISWPFIATGQVIDEETGQGISSTIGIEDGWPHTSGMQGSFARMVESAAPVTALVEAPGYVTVEVTLDPMQRNVIELQRDTLSDIKPDPQIHNDKPVFSLPIAAEIVQLYRPGEDTITATENDGRWHVDQHIPSGAWSLRIDGMHSHNSLFVQSNAIPTPIGRIHEDTIHVTNIDYQAGARVIFFSGPSITELEVLDTSENHLEISSPIVPSDGVYVLINRGEQSAFYTDRPHMFREHDIQELYQPKGCATVSPLLLLFAISIRRMRCVG